MEINEHTQGDWQQLDPRTAERVRTVEEQQFLFGMLRITPDRIARLFDGQESAEDLAIDIRRNLDRSSSNSMGRVVADQVELDIASNLTEVQRQETQNPQEVTADRVQRRTREFAAAVRRALPAHALDRVSAVDDLDTTWTVPNITTTAGGVGGVTIDLTHDFWLNRIQSRDELVASMLGVQIGTMGITHSRSAPTDTFFDQDEVEEIVDSVVGTSRQPFHRRLLRHNAKTLLSDHQVSSINVDTAVQMVMENDQVRRSIVPLTASAAETELQNLEQEKRIATAVLQLQTVEMPNITSSLGSWEGVRNQLADIQQDKNALDTAYRQTTQQNQPPFQLTSISGNTQITFDPNQTVRNREYRSYITQLDEKKRELEEIDRKMGRYAGVLVSIAQDAHAALTRKAPAFSTGIKQMVAADGTINHSFFTGTETPQKIAAELRNELNLKSSPDEYTAAITAKETEKREAQSGNNMLTGRDAVLTVYDNYYRRVARLDPRKVEEAKMTLYARNEQGREESEARTEALDELVGRERSESALSISNASHEFMHGRAEDIVCKLAETDAINAQTVGTRSAWRLGLARRNYAAPKWSALPYPRLMTAYAALKRLTEDADSPIALRRTRYVRTQLNEITSLIADKYTEQAERDYARVDESEEQKKERQAQGERNRKQRLLRLLVHNAVPAVYADRASSAIEEASGRVRRIRRGIATGARATGKFTLNRAKNLFLGKGSNYNPLTYPVKGAKGFWSLINTQLA